MHGLARNFAKSLKNEFPSNYGETFQYDKVYYGKLGSEFVTVESFIEGNFVKYINNTGGVIMPDGSELILKAEAFVYYTYHKSAKQIMVLDIQGVEYNVCDPEIASSKLTDDEDQMILFCSGNLSTNAIDTFISHHICNQFCKQLKLDEN